jgi:hypothetical protein
VQILPLDLIELGNDAAIRGFSLQMWAGRKFLAGFPKLVAKAGADEMRPMQQPGPATNTLTEKPQISARPTIRLQGVKVQKTTPLVASRINKKWLHAECHLSPCHGDDLRRLAAFVPDAENPPITNCSFRRFRSCSNSE